MQMTMKGEKHMRLSSPCLTWRIVTSILLLFLVLTPSVYHHGILLSSLHNNQQENANFEFSLIA